LKRPAFQFYPHDWVGNQKLRRCSSAARGAWIDTLCALHDSDEYGIIRFPLRELASVIHCPVGLLQELAGKFVLKGSDGHCSPFIYVPRHAGKDGPPVTLIEENDGPCWYSSRMVRDEYVRSRSGASTRFQPQAPTPDPTPDPTPTQRHGVRQGDGASSSSSASTSKPRSKPTPGHPTPGFEAFWAAYPKKVKKQEAVSAWKKLGPDEALTAAIMRAIDSAKGSPDWRKENGRYIPHPSTWLNGRRWEDEFQLAPVTPFPSGMRII
jgi:hypothetical protein